MKSKLILLVLTLFVLASSFCSCRIFGKGDKDDTTNGGEVEGDSSGLNVVFSKDVSVTIIRSQNRRTDLSRVSDAIYDVTGKLAPINTDIVISEGNEIIFGDADRDLSRKAKEKLDVAVAKAIRDAEDNQLDTTFIEGYAVYAEGGSVAIVWSDNTAADGAITRFINNFITAEKLVLEDGYIYIETFDLVKLLEEEEERECQGYLDAITEKYDEEVALAVKNYWSLFDDRVYMWLADLYDPGEYD